MQEPMIETEPTFPEPQYPVEPEPNTPEEDE